MDFCQFYNIKVGDTVKAGDELKCCLLDSAEFFNDHTVFPDEEFIGIVEIKDDVQDVILVNCNGRKYLADYMHLEVVHINKINLRLIK